MRPLLTIYIKTEDDYYRYVYDAFYVEFQNDDRDNDSFTPCSKRFNSPTIIIVRAKYNKCTKFIPRYKLAVEFTRIYLLSASLDLLKFETYFCYK